MKCEEVSFLLIEYCEDSLSAGDRLMVEEHVSGCENCRLKLEEIQSAFQLLEKDELPQPEENFWINFLPEVRTKIEKKKQIKWDFFPRPRLIFGSLAILAVAILAISLFIRDNPSLVQDKSIQTKEASESSIELVSSTEQLAELLSLQEDPDLGVESVLSEEDKDVLMMTERIMEQDYVSQKDFSSLFSDLSSEELEKLEESLKNLRI